MRWCDEVARDAVARDAVARDAVARDAVARDAVARDAVARDAVARDAVARDAVDDGAEVARDGLARDEVVRDEVDDGAVDDGAVDDGAVDDGAVDGGAVDGGEVHAMRWSRSRRPIVALAMVVVGVGSGGGGGGGGGCGRVAEAEARRPTSAAVEVAASCASVVDASNVVLAMRVELAAVGVERVTAGGSGDVIVVVECSTAGEVLVASRPEGQRAELPLADVPPDGRARVVALVVAEWLRPLAATGGGGSGGRAGEVRDRSGSGGGVRADGAGDGAGTGRALGPVVRAVSTSEDRVGTVGAVFVLGGGAWKGEIEGAAVVGTNPGGPFVGVLGDLRAAYEPLRVGRRMRLGAVLGLFAAAATSQPGGDRAIAAHAELRLRRGIGASWSAVVSGGGGRGLDNETGWFGMLDVAVVRGF